MPELIAKFIHDSQFVIDFTNLSERGLFSAAWLDEPGTKDLEGLELRFGQVTAMARQDLVDHVLLGRLLGVRVHCLRAVIAGDSTTIRSHYQAALSQCEDLMQALHHAETGELAALAEWTAGVHGLIRAQLAMPDFAEARALALASLDRLSAIHEPEHPGILEDARSAHALAHEPEECALRLHHLPFRVLDRLNELRYQTEIQLSLLNLRLAQVREEHSRAFHATAAWGALNLSLLATLPLNGLYYETYPWSLPFLLTLPAIWWWTWSVPYRDGQRFFDWHQSARHRSLQEFKTRAESLPDCAALFAAETGPILEVGREDLARLNKLCLMSVPDAIGSEHLQEAEKIAAQGRTILRSVWKADMDDSHPVPVAELLPTEPTRIPHATRIYLDPA